MRKDHASELQHRGEILQMPEPWLVLVSAHHIPNRRRRILLLRIPVIRTILSARVRVEQLTARNSQLRGAMIRSLRALGP